MSKLSIIIPVYQEEKNIPELHQRLSAAAKRVSPDYELIFINDGSKDGTIQELKKLSIADNQTFYIDFTRNFGHQIAVSAGLDRCRGDIVVIIDGDLQDPPELIPELYQKYMEGYDVVYARRKERKGEGVFKKMTAAAFYRILRRLTSVDIPIDTGDFRMIDRKVVDALKEMKEQNKFLRGQIAWLGFRSAEVLFSRDKRKHGKTGYSLKKMIHFALDGITSFSNVPLQLVSRLGIIVSFISFLIILYALYSHYFLKETLSGWTSLIISTTFIGGVQLISIGIIGEYISRINKNILNRPLYMVKESNLR